MAAATKTAGKTKQNSDTSVLDEQIDVLEPVAKSVKRKLKHPDGSEKEFIQHELAFLPKLKFIRLLSGTLRLSASEETGGVGAFIGNVIGGIQTAGTDQELASEFLTTILSFAELAPDFIEEAIILALGVKPVDQVWAIEAIQSMDDDLGLDIIEVFVAQNGVALRDFFTKRLPRIGNRLSKEMQIDQLQESETTA